METLKSEDILTTIDTAAGPRIYLKDEKQLARYVAEGLTDSDIAAQYGCTVTMVQMSRRHYRILRATGHPQKIMDRDALVQLLSLGLTSKDIAARFGCSKRCVERAKFRYGLGNRQPENGRRFTDEDRVRLAWMVADGWPVSEITATTGWASQTVLRHSPAGASWTALEAGEFAGALNRIRRDAARHDWLPPTLGGNALPAPIRPYRAQAA